LAAAERQCQLRIAEGGKDAVCRRGGSVSLPPAHRCPALGSRELGPAQTSPPQQLSAPQNDPQTRSGTFQGHPVFLWVSTATYLPLRMIWVTGKSTEVDNWYYLSPTKANLAHLRVPIPPGYPRSG
jgi:hypothetical protein